MRAETINSLSVFDSSALLLGIGLGLRHATDADHVAVVSALVQREPGPLRSIRIAVLWGLGHTTSFLGVGLLVMSAGVHFPAAFERCVSILVAGMLIAFGALHLARSPLDSRRLPSTTRPVAIGLVHGLAGSAGIALLAVTTVHSELCATVYLALFGVGTVLGMVALTLLMYWPIAWSARQPRGVGLWFLRLPGLFSLGLGVLFGVEALT